MWQERARDARCGWINVLLHDAFFKVGSKWALHLNVVRVMKNAFFEKVIIKLEEI